MNPVSPYHLPEQVRPVQYDIFLVPDLKENTFRGQLNVTIEVREPTREICMNAAELEITRAHIVSEEDASFPQEGLVASDAAHERCTITFAETIGPGVWNLALAFHGTLNDQLHGFYRSTYTDKDGNLHTLAVTQFEATDARRAFPCWDEPEFKAVFSVTLVIDPTFTAVSNTAVTSERIVGGKKIVCFADTIKMSTYLVAFVVGELEATDPIVVGTTPIRIWCVPGKKHLMAFAQKVAVACLSFYENYYSIPYPGDKLDLLAVPDFAAGAMENLGAITFRETALLVDEASGTHAELERVADVVAHEVAHMWFGDLVTMKWWNGIWLNEAFATFMELLAVNNWKPEWNRWTTFGVERGAAFALDGLHSTRTVEVEVNSPSDADAMFDVLTYQKGAGVLRMLEQYLGPSVFQNGIREYLHTHQFANASTDDLWQALSRASSQDVSVIMHNWIFSPGYPMVSVRFENEQLVVSQERFTYLPEPLKNLSGASVHAAVPVQDQLWQIPIQVNIIYDKRKCGIRFLLTNREICMDIPGGTLHDAFLLNAGGHGYYRVHYSRELLNPLLSRLDELLPIERFNLVADAWALTMAGFMRIDEYLDFTKHFRKERDKNVWTVLISSFNILEQVIASSLHPKLAALLNFAKVS